MSLPAFPDSDAGYARVARIRMARVLGRGALDPVAGGARGTTPALETVRQAVALGAWVARVGGAEVDRKPPA